MSAIKQGTEEWHDFRSRGIGSSEAAIILGVSPYATPLQLWERKMGLRPEQESSWAMERGKDLEPLARAQYELLNDMEMEPICLVHPNHDFVRASLDGFNAEAKRILEIKCLGQKKHEIAKSGKIPEEYIPQVMHQLLVSGATHCDYYSFDGTSGALVTIEPDPLYIAKLLQAEMAFWRLVQTGQPPEPSERDYVEETDEVNLANLEEWKRKKKQIELLEADCEELRDFTLSRLKHPRMKGAGVRITTSFRKGSVDYPSIPQLRGVNLDIYRKAGKQVTTFTVEKEKSDADHDQR